VKATVLQRQHGLFVVEEQVRAEHFQGECFLLVQRTCLKWFARVLASLTSF